MDLELLTIYAPTQLAAALSGALLLSAVACTPNASDPGAPTPIQVIEADVEEEVIDDLLAHAGIDEQARPVADFHIYRANLPGLDLSAPRCGLRDGGVLPTDCGLCKCMPRYGVVCIDYTCDPAALATPRTPKRGATGTTGDTLSSARTRCDDGRRVGESWMLDCNACTCLADGSTNCTMMSCPPSPGPR